MAITAHLMPPNDNLRPSTYLSAWIRRILQGYRTPARGPWPLITGILGISAIFFLLPKILRAAFRLLVSGVAYGIATALLAGLLTSKIETSIHKRHDAPADQTPKT